MKVLRLLIVIIPLILSGCAQDGMTIKIVSLPENMYYHHEIVPKSMMDIYGKWKLTEVNGGGQSGVSSNSFDFLEFKPFGIYTVIKDNKVVEYGKISTEKFDALSPNPLFQIQIHPDSTFQESFVANLPQRYVDIKNNYELYLISPCCNAYNHHFKKVR